MQPADRIKITPSTKMIKIPMSGNPCDAINNAHKVGHIRSKIPTGLSSLISLKYRLYEFKKLSRSKIPPTINSCTNQASHKNPKFRTYDTSKKNSQILQHKNYKYNFHDLMIFHFYSKEAL